MKLVALLLALLLPAVAPQDEAPERRGLVTREEGATDGYTLYAPLRSGKMLLVDLDGEVVHTWETRSASYGVLLDDGNLLTLATVPEEHPRFHGPGVVGGLLEVLDWDGEVVWSHRIADEDHQVHHDVDVMPGGNLLCLVREYRSRAEAVAAGRDPRCVDEEGMWPDAVYELRPNPDGGAEVVWEWHAWDHLVQDFDETKPGFGVVREHPGRIDLNADHKGASPMTPEELEELRELEREMAALGYGEAAEEEPEDEYPLGSAPDWLHVNAVTLHPELDLLVLSVPRMNELWVLDHSTTTAEAATSTGGRRGRGGEILWRWGNPRIHGAGEEADQRLFFQHDPTWVPGADEDELRLLVFNNGGGDRERGFSSVDELVLPFDRETGFRHEPGGAAFGPPELAWTYRLPDDCFSSFISGVRRLPNGNLFICSGAPGRLLEATREGRVVWDYENPFARDGSDDPPDAPPPFSVYRATRVARDHPGLAGRDL